MLINQFKLLNNNTSQYIIINDVTTDPLKFFVLDEYPVFDIDVKNQEMDKDGQHGIWDFYSYFGKRTITINGRIVGTSEADVLTLKNQLDSIVSLPSQPTSTDNGNITVSWLDANSNEWQVTAKLEKSTRYDKKIGESPNILPFQISLKCPNPIITSASLITETGARGYRIPSLKLSAQLPAKIEWAYINTTTVTNAGTIPANTVIKVYGCSGGLVNPTIYNVTSGKMFKVNMTLADATKWIEIDSELGTVVDQDDADQSGNVDGASEYILLSGGANVLLYTSNATNGQDQPTYTWTDPTTAVIEISYRNTIL